MDIENFVKAISAIKTKHKGTKESVRDTMECPACKGRLHYTVASVNGHTHGKCETENCLAWME